MVTFWNYLNFTFLFKIFLYIFSHSCCKKFIFETSIDISMSQVIIFYRSGVSGCNSKKPNQVTVKLNVINYDVLVPETGTLYYVIVLCCLNIHLLPAAKG